MLLKKLQTTVTELKTIYEEFTDLIQEAENVKSDSELVDNYSWKLETMENSYKFYKAEAKKFNENADKIEKMIMRLKLFIRYRIGKTEEVLGTRKKIVAYDSPHANIDESKLEPDKFVYSIKGLSKSQYDLLLVCLEDYANSQEISGADELALYIQSNTEKKPYGVTKLPEGHPAIDMETTYTVQIKNLNQKDMAYITANMHKQLLPDFTIPEDDSIQ